MKRACAVDAGVGLRPLLTRVARPPGPRDVIGPVAVVDVNVLPAHVVGVVGVRVAAGQVNPAVVTDGELMVCPRWWGGLWMALHPHLFRRVEDPRVVGEIVKVIAAEENV